jgi:hypothetical protein
MNTYPHLADFMGGWFHQDFDIVGDTLEEIVTAFRAIAPPETQAALRSEIAAFLKDHSQNIDEEFERAFNPQVVPSAFTGSTRSFLETIRDLL